MTKYFLITRPNYDIPTSYLYDFSQDIIKKVKASKDIHVTNIEGANVTRKNVEKSIIKEKPNLIFLNGHGTESCVLGHKDDIILDVKNISLANKSIIYALACNSLSKLGEESVKIGIRAYIGYREDFMIVTDPNRTSSPSKDKNARPFKEVCDILITNLVDGYNVDECIKRTKDRYKTLIKFYGTSEDEYGDAPLIRFALTWDFLNLGTCGDTYASF